MKRFVAAIAILSFSTFTYAMTNIQDLSHAWKTEQTLHAKQDKNDITIVYGGADVSGRQTRTIA